MKPSRVELSLRLTPDLHRELVVAAERSGRSLNAEIAYRLRQSFTAWTR